MYLQRTPAQSCGGCWRDRPRRPDDLLTFSIFIIIRRPGPWRGGNGGASGAGTWADEHSTSAAARRASLMAINYTPGTSARGAAGLGLGAWHCHNLSDRRDLEHLGRRGGRRVETRRPGWPGSTTGSQGFQSQRLEALSGVRGRCEARKIAPDWPDWPDWPRLSPTWGMKPAAPASVAVGVPVRT